MNPSLIARIAISIVIVSLLAACGSRPAPSGGASGGAAKAAGDANAGKSLFASKGCVACHIAAGVPGATGTIGPNLDGIGDTAKRPQLAGGLPNTADNLKKWITDPPAVKPGTQMPKLGLSPKEADDLTAFLTSLK
ncbi:MAG: c-type cytochrome [Chloroflexota bacterium]